MDIRCWREFIDFPAVYAMNRNATFCRVVPRSRKASHVLAREREDFSDGGSLACSSHSTTWKHGDGVSVLIYLLTPNSHIIDSDIITPGIPIMNLVTKSP